MKRIKTEGRCVRMKKIVVFILALMLSVMVSVCSAGSDADRVVKSGDMLGLRVLEVTRQVSNLADMVGKMKAGKGKEEAVERLMLLMTEAMLLIDAFGQVDKIVFGFDVLVSIVESGGYLSEANYQASAVKFRKAVMHADDALRRLVDCSFCTARTREVARQALEDLRRWWR
jgi:hypothetical protein